MQSVTFIEQKLWFGLFPILSSISGELYFVIYRLINPILPDSFNWIDSWFDFSYSSCFIWFYYLFLALLICAENSFWNQSNAYQFSTTFSDAFQLYKTSGTRTRIESALNQLENHSEESIANTRAQKRLQTAQYTRIILAHLLSVLNFFYLHFISLTFNS